MSYVLATVGLLCMVATLFSLLVYAAIHGNVAPGDTMQRLWAAGMAAFMLFMVLSALALMWEERR